MNLDSGIACLSAREVKRIGIIVGFEELSAVAAADVLACGAISVTVDIFLLPSVQVQMVLLLYEVGVKSTCGCK